MKVFAVTTMRLVSTFCIILLTGAPAWAVGDALRQIDARGKTEISYYAVRLADGDVLASHDAGRAMLPASVQKIVSSAAAIELMGGDFSFKTRLAMYQNSVIVIGDGDPLIGDPVLAEANGTSIYELMDKWADLLVSRGITEIDQLILDDTVIRERRHELWPKDQWSRWYCAAVSGLNYHDNCVDVYVDFSKGGGVMRVSPTSRYISVQDRVSRSSGKSNLWHMAQSDDCSELVFTGKAARQSVTPVSVAVDSPPMLFGRIFADRLMARGIKFSGQITRRQVRGDDGTLPQQIELLAIHQTPLKDVLHRMNKRSLNFMAECLLLRSCVAAGGQGSYDRAAKKAQEVLSKKYGIAAGQLVISDGGGMSRENRLSARAAVQILSALAKSSNGDIFTASLPVGGADGTLKKRFKNSAGRVIAKTGTLNGVRSLAGYVLGSNGKPEIAFAVFCNSLGVASYKAKNAMDDFVGELMND